METRSLGAAGLLVSAAALASLSLSSGACTAKVRDFGTGGAGGTGSSTGAGGATTVSSSTGGSTGTGGTTSAGPCSDTMSDTHNCGACGNDCDALPNVVAGKVTCSAGACAIPEGGCVDGYGHCSADPNAGCETVTATDPGNCGGCGTACLYAQTCADKLCSDDSATCASTGACLQPFCEDPGHFAVTADVVVDLQNGRRLWERGTGSGMVDFAAATAYCDGLALDGIGGWRVPTTGELSSIVFMNGGLMGCPPAKYCAPAVDQAAFQNTAVDLYWTSTVYQAVGTNYCVSFCDGRSTPYKEDVSVPHFVRCVHDPM